MDKSMNISDRNFHSRITGRYQKGKRNPYDFPLMIFFKNTGQLLSQKINLNVLLQLNITRNITTQHILESVEGIKSLLGWFRIERSIPKQQKVSSLASGLKDIPVFMSFAFEKINSALNRIIYPLFLNPEKSSFNFSLQTFNQIQQFDHIKKYENLPNGVEDISLADNSVSWDYKFVFHNESPVILPHVNLLLRNSKLANSLNYPEVLNDITKSTIKRYDAYFNNYIQIINHGLHPGFEPAILSHVNLLLNSISIQGDSLTSKEYFNFSKLDNKYHVILPHVNLLLRNSKLANSLNYQEVLNDITKPTLKKYDAYFNNYIQIINHGLLPGFQPAILSHVNLLLNSMSIHGDILTSKEYFNFSKLDKKYHVNLPHVNLLLNTISANNMQSQIQDSYFISGQRFDYSFPQADLMGQEFAGDKNIQLRNNRNQKINARNTADHYVLVYNFPAILQHMDTIQKNMPEMILSHSKSFPTSIKHNQGQTSVNLEPIITSDTTTENHDLHFKINRKIEEEIENVKRIAYEAKQTMIESVKNIQTSHEEEMNRKININQLSDQVYRLLDRKITIEKERRGYI